MSIQRSQAVTSPRPFGRYELMELLGSGGMAEVFLAKARGPKGFERMLVIKRILPHLSRDDEFVEMFVSEAKICALLSHGNIVQVYEFGEVDDQLFLAMEYIEGIDLRAVLKNNRIAGSRMAPEVAVFIAIEVLKALSYAHTRRGRDSSPLGIVHRDISPSNILLSPAGEVKLCDFGIAKMIARHTSTGRLKGKFAYMSPEQAGGGGPIDGRSDLFAVGIVLWEMLSGARLFAADSDVSTLGLVRLAEIPELPPVGAPVEEMLRGIVRRALERDPARRYQDADSFSTQLKDYLAIADLGDPARALQGVVFRLQALRAASEVPTGVVQASDSPTPSAVVEILEEPSGRISQPATLLAPDPAPVRAQAPHRESAPSVPGMRRGRSLVFLAAAVVVAVVLAVVLWPRQGPEPRASEPGRERVEATRPPPRQAVGAPPAVAEQQLPSTTPPATTTPGTTTPPDRPAITAPDVANTPRLAAPGKAPSAVQSQGRRLAPAPTKRREPSREGTVDPFSLR